MRLSIPGMYFVRPASGSPVSINLFTFCYFCVAFEESDAVLSMEEDPLMLSKGDRSFQAELDCLFFFAS